jgi:CRP-like cAMP-binding protein
MVPHSLYDVLWGLGPLPLELRLAENRRSLTQFMESRVGYSYHAHRQLLLSAGQAADYIYYVENGLVRGYYYDKEKNTQYTVSLWDEHSFITEPNSFFNKQPSELSIEVMPESTLLFLSGQHLAEIFKAFPYTEVFSRCLMLQYIAYHSQRTRDLISLSAWERYLALLRKQPQIEQKISKEIIASYLGITPQTLSRLIKLNGHP